jgi:steroid 5-alpha reductase family enzyme
MVIVWGLRLSLHVLYRDWRKPQEARYGLWRKQWGDYVVLRSFFEIFMLQGVVMLLIAQPVILINSSFENTLGWLDGIGAAVWMIGFFFESLGDYQLLQFLSNKDNKDKILTTGLWRYTRHPNYFGEAVMWWGIFLLALSVPHGWTAIMSPATITFLLGYVSGIPLAEASLKDNPAFKNYMTETSVFFPWVPKV